MGLEDLIVRPWIEKDTAFFEIKSKKVPIVAKAN